MLGLVFVGLIFIAIVAACLFRPALGAIGFYFFYLLDPKWNWRWVVPQDIAFQKYLFAALIIGLVFQGFKFAKQARPCRRGILLGWLFFVICFISASQSISPPTSDAFNSVLWKELIVAMIAILVIRTRQHVTFLFVASLIGISYNSYQINLDYFQTGFTRFAYSKWGSYQLDNNTLSLMMIPFIAVGLSFAVFERIAWRRVCYFLASLLLIHQVMLTMSRGAMLGALPGIALLLWKAPRSRRNLRDFTIAIACVVVLAGPSVVKEFSTIFESAENRDSSAESRFYLWKAGAKITADHPLLGVGPNAGRYLVPRPQYWEGDPINSGSKALHNVFFDLSTGIGIPGLLIFLSLFAIPMLHAWKTYDRDDYVLGPINLSVLCGLTSYFCASIFSSGLLIESPYIFLVAGYALINIRADEQSSVPGQLTFSTPQHHIPSAT
ncbi:MAG: O-antigen ligase family protein [Rubripirellula sp.]|nr:O-antigen ligase family protein [Rubripirellula sp.]